MLYGPGVYHPTLSKKLAALESYSQILKLLLPTDPTLLTGHLWHNDLHRENIFVHPDTPSKILGILDWRSTQILPLFQHSMDPELLGYDGPDVGDQPQRPKLTRTAGLSEKERTEALRRYYDESLMVAWRMIVEAKNPVQHGAIRFRRSTAGHILHISQNVSVMGEAHVRALILDFRDEWKKRPQSNSLMDFPLQLSEEEVEAIERDVVDADNAVGLMNGIKEQLGNLWPEKGLIEEENYDTVMARLKLIKADLMSVRVKSDEDREVFERFRPFDC